MIHFFEHNEDLFPEMEILRLQPKDFISSDIMIVRDGTTIIIDEIALNKEQFKLLGFYDGLKKWNNKNAFICGLFDEIIEIPLKKKVQIIRPKFSIICKECGFQNPFWEKKHCLYCEKPINNSERLDILTLSKFDIETLQHIARCFNITQIEKSKQPLIYSILDKQQQKIKQ